MDYTSTLSQIIERELGGVVVDVRDITTGYAGHVYVGERTFRHFEGLILGTVRGAG